MVGRTVGLAAEGDWAAAEPQPQHCSQVGAILQLYHCLTETRRQRMNISMQGHSLLWDDPVAIPQSGAVNGWQAEAPRERAPPVSVLGAMTIPNTWPEPAQSQHCLWHPFPAWMLKAVLGLFPVAKRGIKCPHFPLLLPGPLPPHLRGPSATFRIFLDIWYFAALLCPLVLFNAIFSDVTHSFLLACQPCL